MTGGTSSVADNSLFFVAFSFTFFALGAFGSPGGFLAGAFLFFGCSALTISIARTT
jgi:hypothetical protein